MLLANGSIPELLLTNMTSFPYLFELSYACKDGYRLIGGDSWRTCGENGWSGKTPYCEGKNFDDSMKISWFSMKFPRAYKQGNFIYNYCISCSIFFFLLYNKNYSYFLFKTRDSVS